MLAALAVLVLAGPTLGGERPGPETPARAAERDAWLGRACAAPGCAAPRPAPAFGHAAAFAGAVLAAVGLVRRRETEA